MSLHSPLAAVLAGVELALRKAQDWEQNAHRGVSMNEELRPLSALVVRWRALELKSWPLLLDARERSFAIKVMRQNLVSRIFKAGKVVVTVLTRFPNRINQNVVSVS